MANPQELRTFQDIYTAVIEALKEQTNDTTVLARVKRLVNIVYLNKVVSRKNWSWLRANTNINIRAAKSNGTVSVTKGDINATLSATESTSREGKKFAVPGHNTIYTITSHAAGSAAIQLDTPYAGATDTVATYNIFEDEIPLPTDCLDIEFVSSPYTSELIGTNLSTLRRLRSVNPKLEGRPAYYSMGNRVDPDRFESISGLPAVSTRSSAGHVRTIVFASDVSAYFWPGRQIRVNSTNTDAFTDVFTVSSVSTTTITFTADFPADSSATADTGMTIEARTYQSDAEGYPTLMVYPSINTESNDLNVDYIRQAQPLVADSDEPLIPLNDRSVLYDGTLSLAWATISRNPEQAMIYKALYEEKLTEMSGRASESSSLPKMEVAKTYLASKRSPVRRNRKD